MSTCKQCGADDCCWLYDGVCRTCARDATVPDCKGCTSLRTALARCEGERDAAVRAQSDALELGARAVEQRDVVTAQYQQAVSVCRTALDQRDAAVANNAKACDDLAEAWKQRDSAQATNERLQGDAVTLRDMNLLLQSQCEKAEGELAEAKRKGDRDYAGMMQQRNAAEQERDAVMATHAELRRIAAETQDRIDAATHERDMAEGACDAAVTCLRATLMDLQIVEWSGRAFGHSCCPTCGCVYQHSDGCALLVVRKRLQDAIAACLVATTAKEGAQ